MTFTNFIGGSHQSQSPNFNAERAINLFVESQEAGNAKSAAMLVGTPGLIAFGAALPTSPVRGVWAGAGRLFVVSGAYLYELSATGAIVGLGGPTDHTTRGLVGNDAANSPAQIFPNGNQLLILSAGAAYVDSGLGPVAAMYPTLNGVVTNGQFIFKMIPPFSNWVAVSVVDWVSGDQFDPRMTGQPVTITGAVGGSNPNFVMQVVSNTRMYVAVNTGTLTSNAYTAPIAVTSTTGAFLDGYFIVSPAYSKQFNISAINNGSLWAALDNGVKQGYPDNIAAVFADHEELWLFGTDTTEIWQNTGNASFPLERIPGAFANIGLLAWATPARLNDGVAFLGVRDGGGPVAFKAVGFVPQRISTHALEHLWAGYTTVADAVGYSYVDDGHEFYVISFPTAGTCFGYDDLTKLWHERMSLNGGLQGRFRGACHAYVNAWGKHFVGDFATGQVYQMTLSAYDEAGAAITRQRVAPHKSGQASPAGLMSAQELWTFYHRFILDVETGQGAAPAIALDWSDDGGHTFGAARTMPSAGVGAYAFRTVLRRLGKARDRVFRVTIVSAARVAIIAAYIDATAGLA